MSYQDYVALALETIARQLLSHSLQGGVPLDVATVEQAKGVFSWYMATCPDSILTYYQQSYGLYLLHDLPLLWPAFLYELQQGVVGLPRGDAEMSYEEYVGDALEQIGLEILYQLEDPLKLYGSTCEQAKEAYLHYVSTYTGSQLALFQERYGARLQSEFAVLWPFFLHEGRQGRV